MKDSNGKFHSLIDYKGSWLVLYFYPKDDTPGCTVEACGFRDMRDELTDLGAQVVGISKDDISLHEKFKSKYNLNFTLLSDPKGEVIETYGAWGPKMFGRLGIQRKTFLIDPDGMIQKVYARVIPKGHNQQVINDLQRLRAE
ncbi:peroxiredoxin [Candidatus Saccharibacteria bacterium]|nr:peroxiredoxin [Candidatus Saccharibacteria bacterium]